LKSLALMSVEDAQHLSGPVNIWITLPRQQIPNQLDETGNRKHYRSNALRRVCVTEDSFHTNST